MPRRARVTPGGLVYHVLNRSVARLPLFRKHSDFEAFERIMIEAHGRHPIRVLAWCLMRNHWHFVLWPREEGEVTTFLRWLAHTHAMRWHVAHGTVGCGHLYQGRFKSFPIQEDEHFLSVCRYVERNALSAGIVDQAEQWRWGSLWARRHGPPELKAVLSDWPVDRPRNWVRLVNTPMTKKEAEHIRTCIALSATTRGKTSKPNNSVFNIRYARKAALRTCFEIQFSTYSGSHWHLASAHSLEHFLGTNTGGTPVAPISKHVLG